MRKVIYSIEGNIGSGKSTLLKSLMASMHEVTTIPEPVDSWQHVGQYNLLDKYYQNPQRWGYTFQINCILSRMNQLSHSIQTMHPNKVYISQRSIQSDKFIFAKLMHRLNKMNDMQYYLYQEMFKSLQGLFNKHVFSQSTNNKMHVVTRNKEYVQLQTHKESNIQRQPSPIQYRHIYLKTSAEKCFERIKKRNRSQERNMEFGYIKELDNLHDEWLVQGEEARKGGNLVLDGQREFQTDKNYMNELINRIKSYIIENSPESFDIDRMSNATNSRIKSNYNIAQARKIYFK